MEGGVLGQAAALASRRPLCFAACCFGLGVRLGVGVDGAAFLSVALGLALAAWLASRALPGLATLAMLLAFFFAGAGAAGNRASVVGVPPLDGEALLEGRVSGQPTVEDGRTRFLFAAERSLGEGGRKDVRFGLRASLDGSHRFLPGDYLRLKVRLRAIDPPLNPGAPDLLTRAIAEGVAANATVVERQYAVLGEPSRWGGAVAGFREAYGRLVDDALAHPESAALLRALAIGERTQLGDEVNEDFARSGLAHVLSVSGLHIAVVAFGIFRLLRWLLSKSEALLLRADARTLASVASIPGTWLYVALTGAEAPAVRSGIMASALFLALALGRDEDGPSSLAAALLAVLAWDPAAIRSLSFLLSFGSVAGLMLLTTPLRRMLPVAPPAPAETGWRPWLVRLRETMLLAAVGSLAASLATGPLVAVAFQRASLVAMIANAVALPLASLLTGLAAASALAFAIAPSAAALLVILAAPLARALLWVSHAFAGLPFASARLAAPSAAELFAWYLALLAIPLLRSRRRLGRRLLASGILALVVLAGSAELGRRLDRRLTLTFLAVGQGDATLVRLPGGRALLVDGGGDPAGRWDVGARVVVPALVALGVRELDAVVLSHPHPDHCLGLISVLRELPVRELWIAPGAERGALLDQLLAVAHARGTRLRELGARERVEDFAPVRIEALHPPPGSSFEGNDASLVLRVALGEVSFLLAGDVEAEAEASLLGRAAPRATVLKAPHHGSSTSSTGEFVRAVGPRHVVFSVGRAGNFGFPHAPVVARYQQAGAILHRTDRDGAVSFATDGRQLLVDHYRRRRLPLSAVIDTLFGGRQPEERP